MEQNSRKMENWHWRRNMHRFIVLFWNYSINSLNLGEEEIPLKEYCELLDAGLEEAKVGVIPPSLDQVLIGDMERTRIKNIRALFFVGANDTLLPGNAGARGLLSERDRKQFQEKKMNLSPGPKERNYIFRNFICI